ncbi:RpL9, partial [Symbiodinium sp. KB8]
TVSVNARVVTVKGPRGELSRDFKHLNLDVVSVGKRRLRVDLWFGARKDLACVRTICSHIKNMMVGVTKGFCYKLRAAYAHFPVTIIIENGEVRIQNFLGERRQRIVKCLPGVTAVKSDSVKDQIELTGNDLEAVSRTAALIHQSCLVRKKDIRKFLDG